MAAGLGGGCEEVYANILWNFILINFAGLLIGSQLHFWVDVQRPLDWFKLARKHC